MLPWPAYLGIGVGTVIVAFVFFAAWWYGDPKRWRQP